MKVKKYISSNYMPTDFPFCVKAFHHNSDRVPHWHDFIELVYVQRGEAIHEFEGEQYAIGPGDVFIINPGEVHRYRIQQGGSLDIINCLFTPALIRESLLHELRLVNAMDFLYVLPFLDDRERFHHRLRLDQRESATVRGLLEGMIEECEEAGVGYRSLVMMKLVELLVLLSRYYRKKRDRPDDRSGNNDIRARRICGYLERHAYQEINAEMVARLFHVSCRQLNRIMKKETGHSLMEAVQRLRVERAKNMLRETEDTVISIATAVGYESSSFFNRLFTRQVGCPPSAYRAEHRHKTIEIGTMVTKRMG